MNKIKAITIDDARFSLENFLNIQPPNWHSSSKNIIYTVNSKNEQYELLLLLLEHALVNFSFCFITTTNNNLLDKLAILIDNNFGKDSLYNKKIVVNQMLEIITDTVFVFHHSKLNFELIKSFDLKLKDKTQNFPFIIIIDKFKDFPVQITNLDIKYTGIRVLWDRLPSDFYNNKREIIELKKDLPTNKRILAGLKPISPSKTYIDFNNLLNLIKNRNEEIYININYLERDLLNFGPKKLKRNIISLLKTIKESQISENSTEHNFLQKIEEFSKLIPKSDYDIKLNELKHIFSFIEPKDERRVLLFTSSRKISSYIIFNLRKSNLKMKGNFISGSKLGSTRKMTNKQERNFWFSFDAEEFDVVLLDKCIDIKEFNFSRLTDIIFYGPTIEPIIKVLHEKDTLDFFDTKIHLLFVKDTYEEQNIWRLLRT